MGQHRHQSNTHEAGIRLDIWLFRTRLVKSRSLATKMILKGKVRIHRNGQTERTLKPHVTVRPGDIITFMHAKKLNHIEMLTPGTRRGPAGEARQLYRHIPHDIESDD